LIPYQFRPRFFKQRSWLVSDQLKVLRSAVRIASGYDI